MKTALFYRGLLLGIALLLAMPMSAAAKCQGVGPERKLLVVLDGRQTTEAEFTLRNLPRDSVEAIHILCWNPSDSTFLSSPMPRSAARQRGSCRWANGCWTSATPAQLVSFAIGGRVGVVRIMTKGLVDRLVAALYRAADTGSRVALDDEVVVELTADGTQWSATLKQGAMVHTCILEVGRPSPSTVSDRQRSCTFSIAEGEKHALSIEG
jgi:hypothetical protein